MAATKIAASRKQSAKTKQDAFKVISTMHAVRHSIDKFKGSETNSKYVCTNHEFISKIEQISQPLKGDAITA